jgi:hypothetical protein
MHDQGDHSEYQQQVDQAAGDVEYREAAQPRNQQNYEQNCPDAHFVPPELTKNYAKS